MNFICPVCGEELKKQENSLLCINNHSYDIAKKGYVNLLLRHSGGLHGDSKDMIKARSEFLDAGYYQKLQNGIVDAVKFCEEPKNILDCGCGEGYYTSAIKNAYANSEILAIDISKDALICAYKRNKAIKYAVASAFNLPVASGSQDVALNIFSPFVREEYFRVLKSGGILIMAIPLEKHLFELKKAVYDEPYLNEPHDTFIDGFELINEEKLDYSAVLNNKELSNLFKMTPYYIKTSPKDMEKLSALESLKIGFSFKILVYKKA